MKSTLILHYDVDMVQLTEPVRIKSVISQMYKDTQYFVGTKEINNKHVILFYYTLNTPIDDEEMSLLEMFIKLRYAYLEVYSV